jgi:hypothetical protein
MKRQNVGVKALTGCLGMPMTTVTGGTKTMKQAEAVSCIIVAIPLLLTAMIVVWCFFDLLLGQYKWYVRFKSKVLEAEVMTDEQMDEHMHNVAITMGAVLIIVPLITVYIYSYGVEKMQVVDYITMSWQNVRIK